MKRVVSYLLALLFVFAVSFVTPVLAEDAMEGATATKESSVEIIDLLIATAIIDREPINVDTTFAPDVGKLYCFSRLGVNVDEAGITHTWYFEGEEIATIGLKVRKSPAYRTFSSKRVMEHQKGVWRVEVSDDDGNVLKSVAFNIE